LRGSTEGKISISDDFDRPHYEYWQGIFEKGKTQQGLQMLVEPINLMKMI
jgi:hypothetical protein